jgi:hypothetical protein
MPDADRHPMLSFDEHSEIAVWWSVPMPTGDWLACVYRDGPGCDWIAKHRSCGSFFTTSSFRYVADALVWGSQDRKNEYHMRPKVDGASVESRDRLIEAMDIAFALNAAYAAAHGVVKQPDRIEIFGGTREWHQKVRSRPYMNMMAVGPQN